MDDAIIVEIFYYMNEEGDYVVDEDAIREDFEEKFEQFMKEYYGQ